MQNPDCATSHITKRLNDECYLYRGKHYRNLSYYHCGLLLLDVFINAQKIIKIIITVLTIESMKMGALESD